MDVSAIDYALRCDRIPQLLVGNCEIYDYLIHLMFVCS